MKRTTLVASLAVAVLGILNEPALAQGVAGTYLVEYPARIQNTNGEENVQMGKARLTLQVKGDSVVGTWLVLDRANAQPSGVRGTLQGSTAKFSLQSEGRISQGGEERTIKVTTDFMVKVSGDKVEGTMQLRSDGGMTQPERKFSGVREKAE